MARVRWPPCPRDRTIARTRWTTGRSPDCIRGRRGRLETHAAGPNSRASPARPQLVRRLYTRPASVSPDGSQSRPADCGPPRVRAVPSPVEEALWPASRRPAPHSPPAGCRPAAGPRGPSGVRTSRGHRCCPGWVVRQHRAGDEPLAAGRGWRCRVAASLSGWPLARRPFCAAPYWTYGGHAGGGRGVEADRVPQPHPDNLYDNRDAGRRRVREERQAARAVLRTWRSVVGVLAPESVAPTCSATTGRETPRGIAGIPSRPATSGRGSCGRWGVAVQSRG